jgi:hypothetical protein
MPDPPLEPGSQVTTVGADSSADPVRGLRTTDGNLRHDRRTGHDRNTPAARGLRAVPGLREPEQ